ncbi:MAG: DUF6067 family protein [Kiritimatiellae bacterium]|nr:DUF6067 family protein [Kiritimatiellia bacterium]
MKHIAKQVGVLVLTFVAQGILGATETDSTIDPKCNIPGVTEGPMTDDAVLALMEKSVEPSVWAAYKAAHAQGFWTFGESRMRPVRNNIKPAHWFVSGSSCDAHLTYDAQPGEWFAVQFCVVSETARKMSWRLASTGAVQPASIELISKPAFDVAAGAVQPLWAIVVVPKDAAGRRLELVAEATDAASGERHAVRYALDVKGAVLADGGVTDAWRLARLRWLNASSLGREPVVTKPFAPLTVDRATRTIRLTGKELVLGGNGLPAQIVSHYNGSNTRADAPAFNVLSEPMSFDVTCGDAGKAAELVFTKIAPDEVTWQATVGGANGFSVFGRCDYTGSLSFRVVPAAGVKAASLTVTLPASVVRYMEGLGRNGGTFPKDPLHWTWNINRHQDAVWVGRVNAGLALRFKGANYERPLVNAYYRWKKLRLPESWGVNGSIDLAHRTSDGAATIVARGEGQGEYNFDLYLTPFHPLDLKQHFADRYHHNGANLPNDQLLAWAKQRVAEGCTVFNLHHAKVQNPYINYPYNDDAKPYLHAIIKAVHDAGGLFKLYYTTREISQNIPEFFAFRSLNGEVMFPRDASVKGWPVTNSRGPHPWVREHIGTDVLPAWRATANFKDFYPPKLDLAVITTPETRFDNYFLSGLEFLVTRYGIDGIYIDDTALSADAMKRARRILDRDGKRRLVDNHSWNHHNPHAGSGSSGLIYLELYPFFDRLWRGESFSPRSPADFWLVEMSGLCYGIGSEILDYNGGGSWNGLVFAMTHRHGYNKIDPSPFWRYFDQARLGDSEMLGWWDDACPIGTSDPEVKATVYRRPDGTLTVAVANFASTAKTVTLSARSSLGFTPKNLARVPAIDRFQAEGTRPWQQPFDLRPQAGCVIELTK